MQVIRAFLVLVIGLFAASAVRGEAIGPFDGTLSPTPPRAGDVLQLALSSAGSCATTLPVTIDVQRAGADLEVLVGSSDACSIAAPVQTRAYAIGVVEPGVERVVVYSCEGNPPPGAPRCRVALTLATATAPGQLVESVPVTTPAHLVLLAAATLLAGLVAARRTALP